MKLKIEDWAMYQSWENLSVNQQKEVLTQMSQSEYQALYEQLQGIRKLDAAILPPLNLRNNLLAYLEARPQPVKKWAQPKIPLWQAAAAVVLGILATHYFVPNVVPVPEARVVYVRDTLLQERVVWKEKLVPQVVYRDRDTLEVRPLNNPKGVSLEDTPELLGLFTQAEQ